MFHDVKTFSIVLSSNQWRLYQNGASSFQCSIRVWKSGFAPLASRESPTAQTLLAETVATPRRTLSLGSSLGLATTFQVPQVSEAASAPPAANRRDGSTI